LPAGPWFWRDRWFIAAGIASFLFLVFNWLALISISYGSVAAWLNQSFRSALQNPGIARLAGHVHQPLPAWLERSTVATE